MEEFLALDDALSELKTVDPRLAQVVELRFFAGVLERDIAAGLVRVARTIPCASTWKR